MNWKVYIVQCADETLYTGITNNVPSRVATHNTGRGAKYTKNRLPVVLVYQEEVDDKSHALRREREIKEKQNRRRSQEKNNKRK